MSKLTTPITEWNLGFAYTDVIARLEKMLAEKQIPYTQETTDTQAHFIATLPDEQGRIELTACPAVMSRSSALLQAVRERTMLGISFHDIKAEEEKAFMQRLTIAFLRVGG